MADKKNTPTIKWTMLSPIGPCMAYHVGALMGDTIYIHGGVDRKGSTSPLGKLCKFDFGSGIWMEVRAANSPCLSHHACVVLQNRYIVLIGGWNGKARTGDVYVFDTELQTWTKATTTGFPIGAGLSSHTATVGKNGDILVIGREGSLRTQRRAGSAFILTGDVKKGIFQWHEFPIEVDSRSGHTTTILGSYLYVIGGRMDKLVECHKRFVGAPPHPGATFTSQLASLTSQLTPMSKLPGGRKNHIVASGSNVILLHGGETFDGRSRDPVADMFLLSVKERMQWYRLGSGEIGRAGHVCPPGGSRIIIHGGVGARGMVFGDTYELKI